MNAFRKNMFAAPLPHSSGTRWKLFLAVFAATLVSLPSRPTLANETSSFPRPIPKLPAGTPAVDRTPNAAWNRLVLIAKPKINSGDTNVLSSTIRDAATQCSLTVMARIDPPSKETPTYQLTSVGVGFSALGESGQVIVTADSASRLKVPIGFIGRQVLRTNEEQLEKVQLIALTSTLALFDAPSVMFLSGRHVQVTTRHLIWIDANSGKGAALAWLLVPSTSGFQVAKHPIRAFSFNTKETRKIHVDGDEFGLFGIPSETALALEDLPPGMDIQWTKPAAAAAARNGYTLPQITELATAMNHAMTLAKVSSTSNNE